MKNVTPEINEYIDDGVLKDTTDDSYDWPTVQVASHTDDWPKLAIESQWGDERFRVGTVVEGDLMVHWKRFSDVHEAISHLEAVSK